ncbi:hypothetical protein HDU67_002365 [Dinochytrium kinnereticum]|nr:hypothetical protein HDU67_002365 [Dinochytrium kinnereticum]
MASLASSSVRHPVSGSFSGGIHEMEEGQRSAKGSSRPGSAFGYGGPGTPASTRPTSRRPSAASIMHMLAMAGGVGMEERSESFRIGNRSSAFFTTERMPSNIEMDAINRGAMTGTTGSGESSGNGTTSTSNGSGSGSHFNSESGTSSQRHRTFRRTDDDQNSDYIYVSDSGIMAPGNIYRVPSHSSIPGDPIGSKRWSEFPPPPATWEAAAQGPSSKSSKRKSVGDAFIQAGAYIRELRKSNSFIMQSPTFPAQRGIFDDMFPPSVRQSSSSSSSTGSKGGNLPRVLSAPNVASMQRPVGSVRPIAASSQFPPNSYAAVGRRGGSSTSVVERGRWPTGAEHPGPGNDTNLASTLHSYRSRSAESRLPPINTAYAGGYSRTTALMFEDGGDEEGERSSSFFVPPFAFGDGRPYSAFDLYRPSNFTPMSPGPGTAGGGIRAFADGDEEISTLDRPSSTTSFTHRIAAVGYHPGYAGQLQFHQPFMPTLSDSARRPQSMGGQPISSFGDIFADGDGGDFATAQRPRFSLDGDEENDADEDTEDQDDEGEAQRVFKPIGTMAARSPVKAVAGDGNLGIGRASANPPQHRSPNRNSAPNLQFTRNPNMPNQPPPQLMAHPPPFMMQPMYQPYHSSLSRPPVMTMGYPPSSSVAPPGFPIPAPQFFMQPYFTTTQPPILPEMIRSFSDEVSNSSSLYYAPSSRAGSPAHWIPVGATPPPSVPQDSKVDLPTITEITEEGGGTRERKSKEAKKTGRAVEGKKTARGIITTTELPPPITTRPISGSVLGTVLGTNADGPTTPSSPITPSTRFSTSTHPTTTTSSSEYRTQKNMSPVSTTSRGADASAPSTRQPRMSATSAPVTQTTLSAGGGTLTSHTSISSVSKPRFQSPITPMLPTTAISPTEENVRRSFAGMVRTSEPPNTDDVTALVESIQAEVRNSFVLSSPVSKTSQYVAADSMDHAPPPPPPVVFEAVDSLDRAPPPPPPSVMVALGAEYSGKGRGKGGVEGDVEASGKKKRSSWWRR